MQYSTRLIRSLRKLEPNYISIPIGGDTMNLFLSRSLGRKITHSKKMSRTRNFSTRSKKRRCDANQSVIDRIFVSFIFFVFYNHNFENENTFECIITFFSIRKIFKIFTNKLCLFYLFTLYRPWFFSSYLRRRVWQDFRIWITSSDRLAKPAKECCRILLKKI